jgi:hypothetical protein
MKNVLLAVMVAAAGFLTGCATATGSRLYTINAVGYAEVENGKIEQAKMKATANARQNLVANIARFMEYKFTIDPELEQKILFYSKAGQQGVHNNTYYAAIDFELDMYNFMAKNADFKNIYAWEILGLTPFYSEYVNAYRPIGIWIKDQLADGKRRDPVGMAALSGLPCFSGNFMIGKPIIGGFFTAAKLMCLGGATLDAQQSKEVRITSWVGLAALTVLDVMSVFTETSAMNEKLKYLQNALFAEGTSSGAVYASVKF